MHLALVVLEQLAEDLGRCDELRRGELLAADRQNVVLGKGAVERGAGFGIDSLVEVNAAHFGASMRGQRGDRVFHQAASSTSARMRAASMANDAPVLQYLHPSAARAARFSETYVLHRSPAQRP